MSGLEKQDLGISEAHVGDKSWGKPDLPQPSEERLKAPSSWVNVCNTSNEQIHIVMDRYMHGHEIAPGQTVNIELLNTDIDYFIERRKARVISRIINGAMHQHTVQHPIEIRDEFSKPLAPRSAPKQPEANEVSAKVAARR